MSSAIPTASSDDRDRDDQDRSVALIRAENGELTESSHHRELRDQRRSAGAASSEGGRRIDEASAESFPGSDPPSSWAGEPEEDLGEPPHRQIVGSRELEDDERLAVPPDEDYERPG